jgi:hypothetical protein
MLPEQNRSRPSWWSIADGGVDEELKIMTIFGDSPSLKLEA